MSNTNILYGTGSWLTVFGNTASSGFRCPVPIVTLDTTDNTDIDSNILSTTSTIQLEGHVISTGISGCLSGYSGIVNFFSAPEKQGQLFKIECSSSPIASYSGTVFKSSSARPSENNWVVTLPYTINLESVSSTGNALIESYDDSWTIEPLEDVSYYDFTKATNLLDFKNTGSAADTSYPPSPTDLTATSKTFKINNFLQYRITHRVSAVGKSINRSNPNNPSTGGGVISTNSKSQAYIEAATWVSGRLPSINQNPIIAGSGGLSVNNGTSALSGLHLYNHIRSIESNISAGSYGVTDTWLALGTGVVFVEEFTMDVSTENYVQTVTLQGTIKGLETADISSDTYVIFPSSLMTGFIGDKFLNNFKNQKITNNKFDNAVSGYISGVKPYLYERASLALSAMQKPADGVRTDRAGKPLQIIQPSVYGRLNITPLNYSESLNPNAGTVGYNIVYNNKPGSWVSGALSSTLSITENNQSDLVAETFVLGRPLGPILERVGFSKSERRVNLEIVYPIPTGYNDSHPNSSSCIINKDRAEYKQLEQLMFSFKPIAPVAFATLVPTSSYGVALQGIAFKTSDNQTWNPFEGRFSWDITWIYNTGNCL
jgi:hypothetical protein